MRPAGAREAWTSEGLDPATNLQGTSMLRNVAYILIACFVGFALAAPERFESVASAALGLSLIHI